MSNGFYIPSSDVPPIWQPEFFGNTMVVNGKTWPKLDVEPRRYRFRFLNGCDSRFLILKIVTNPIASRPATPILPFWQIGSEGGFLRAPAQLPQLLMSPAERADVIVDFTGLAVGTEVYLINEGPDEPFSGESDSFANPNTTGQVLKLTVVPLTSKDKSVPPNQLKLPTYTPLGSAIRTRKLSLNEDSPPPNNIPVAVLLGTLDAGGNPVPQLWEDPITENPGLNDTEIWELYNFTVDAHPIHVHLVQFEVINRQPFNGATRSPEPWEIGRKDTVIAYPGEITRIKATFDLPGNYVWHCHIVEHEDNEMMRPYRVGPYQKGAPETEPYSDAPPNATKPRQRRAVQRQRGILRQENIWDDLTE
jgi:spore coat protein A, manganese oxidase